METPRGVDDHLTEFGPVVFAGFRVGLFGQHKVGRNRHAKMLCGEVEIKSAFHMRVSVLFSRWIRVAVRNR